jgi:cell division septal protein FtsQ
VAKRLGTLRRPLVIFAGLALLALVAYLVLGRNSTVAPRLVSSDPVAAIGEGSEAAVVAGDGTILTWFPAEEADDLPRLPLETTPKGPRVQGPALEQTHVLAAMPVALRPYVEGSEYGEGGVDVNLTSGIELRFGNDTQAVRKWKAAAAVLADPTIVTLDYVDVLAPSRPTTGGSGHTLPAIP